MDLAEDKLGSCVEDVEIELAHIWLHQLHCFTVHIWRESCWGVRVLCLPHQAVVPESAEAEPREGADQRKVDREHQERAQPWWGSAGAAAGRSVNMRSKQLFLSVIISSHGWESAWRLSWKCSSGRGSDGVWSVAWTRSVAGKFKWWRLFRGAIKKVSLCRTDLFWHGKRSHEHFQHFIPRDWLSPRTEKKITSFKHAHSCEVGD